MMHCLHEPNGLVLVGSDEQEVVHQTHKHLLGEEVAWVSG